jgi:type I restriction enzyme S subunit
MNKNEEQKLVPRLRFPEFEDAWNLEQLSNLLVYERPDNYIVKDTSYLTKGTPVLTANKSFILGYTQELFGVYNDIPAVIFDDFTVDKKYVDFPFKVKSSAIKILRPKGEDDLKFIFELMSLIQFEAKEHKRYYISAYQNLIVSIPQPHEQQKIASCLSSLDEVITAESQKLDVLKEHKKGLLQNLLPREGETVPKFRFKEFEGSGEWVEKTIEQVAKVTTGSKDTQNKVDNGEYPFFVRSQNVERINSYSYDGEAILTSGDGVGVGKNFHYIIGRFDFHQRVYCIYDFEKDVSGRFVYVYFSQHFFERVMRMTAKNSVDSVRRNMITEMPILMTSKSEQDKIADTLSSVDILINAQNQKVDALKLHKNGLLQGLFPDINEINE